MNQKICFVPRFVRAAVRWTRTRTRTWGDGQTAKNARRTGAAAVHFTSLSLLFSYPLLCHLFLSLSFVFVIQFICFVCSVEGRKKCKKKAAKICGRYWTQQISSRSWQAQEKWEASTCRYSVKELNYNSIHFLEILSWIYLASIWRTKGNILINISILIVSLFYK